MTYMKYHENLEIKYSDEKKIVKEKKCLEILKGLRVCLFIIIVLNDIVQVF